MLAISRPWSLIPVLATLSAVSPLGAQSTNDLIGRSASYSASSPVTQTQITRALDPNPVPEGPQRVVKHPILPLTFESNEGQADSSAHFVARGAGYTLL